MFPCELCEVFQKSYSAEHLCIVLLFSGERFPVHNLPLENIFEILFSLAFRNVHL